MKFLSFLMPIALLISPVLAQNSPQSLKSENVSLDSRTLTDSFNHEVLSLQSATQNIFTIQVLRTNDPSVRNFIAQGILKMNPDIYTQMESGLAGMYVHNGQMNGRKGPICYILNNPDRSEHLWKGFVLNQTAQPTQEQVIWAARFMLSHEIGHCLDQADRLKKVIQSTWNRDQSEMLGIATSAYDRTFGLTGIVDYNTYQGQIVVLARDGAQMQYQERVADAFAIFWLKQHQAPQLIFDAILKQRQQTTNHAAYHAHATVPTVKQALNLSLEMPQNQNIDDLWKQSRLAQQRGGVDESLWQGSRWVHADAEKREAVPGQKPGETAPNGTKPAVINFSRMKKFGQ